MLLVEITSTGNLRALDAFGGVLIGGFQFEYLVPVLIIGSGL